MRCKRLGLALLTTLTASLASAYSSYSFTGKVTIGALGWTVGDSISGLLTVNSVDIANPHAVGTGLEYDLSGSLSVTHGLVTTISAFHQVADMEALNGFTAFWRADSAASAPQFTELLRFNGVARDSSNAYLDPFVPLPNDLGTFDLIDNTIPGSSGDAQASITSFVPVPEPVSTLLGLGAVVLFLKRRRR